MLAGAVKRHQERLLAGLSLGCFPRSRPLAFATRIPPWSPGGSGPLRTRDHGQQLNSSRPTSGNVCVFCLNFGAGEPPDRLSHGVTGTPIQNAGLRRTQEARKAAASPEKLRSRMAALPTVTGGNAGRRDVPQGDPLAVIGPDAGRPSPEPHGRYLRRATVRTRRIVIPASYR